jgi:hypothetical protein
LSDIKYVTHFKPPFLPKINSAAITALLEIPIRAIGELKNKIKLGLIFISVNGKGVFYLSIFLFNHKIIDNAFGTL